LLNVKIQCFVHLDGEGGVPFIHVGTITDQLQLQSQLMAISTILLILKIYCHLVLISGLVAVGVSVLMPWILRLSNNFLPRQISRMASSARSMEEFSMAFVTAPNQEKAKELASGLVSGKLAACVNIIPGVQSVYEWED